MNFQELAENLGLEVDEYRELIELFVDTGAADFQTIQDALAGGSSEQVMRAAHTIKGAAGNLGLMDVSEIAKSIEDCAIKNQLDSIGPAIEILRTQFETIEAFVYG